MIVRCTNCNSAFAVKDEKVANKKFAFNCPKCSAENIIDNKDSGHDMLGGGEFAGTEEFEAPKAGVGTAMAVDDDFGGLPEFDREPTAKPQPKKPVPEDDLDLGDFDLGEEKPSSGKSAAPEDDIFFDETIESGKKSDRKAPEDEFDLDLDIDDSSARKKSAGTPDELEIDVAGDLDLEDIEIAAGKQRPVAAGKKKDEDYDIGAEIGSLDELDDIPVYDEKNDISPAKGAAGRPAEEDLLADFEPLELDAEKTPSKKAPGGETGDLDDFFIEPSSKEKIKTEEVYSKDEADEDESITIDLDSLEIDLDEGDNAPKGSQAAKARTSEPDDDITLDLDTLDIDLKEGETISEGEKPDDIEAVEFFEEPARPASRARHKEEEDITLDLDSLDIQLDETSEIKKGEVPDDDEKITLEDAGLTIEELTAEELSSATASKAAPEDEEDIKLSIDDIDPSLSVDNIEKKLKEADDILGEETLTDRMDLLESGELESDEDVPDIDFESFEGEAPSTASAKKRVDMLEDDLIDIESNIAPVDAGGKKKGRITDTVPGGSVNLSADYSIKYSRSGALIRLAQLFLLAMVPHFIVLTLYTVLSIILGFINNLVVLSTKQAIEDFSEIQENTIRYFLSISASLLGFVEEAPIFAGRERIDYALQMNVTSPYRRSRLLSALRLSVVGILAAAAPHLLILGILAVVIPLIYIIGLFSVIFTGRWPFFLFDFLTRYYRYTARVLAYIAGLVDRYPTFRFD
ncbi:MAG TPA: DUF4389 domain-containing protein [Spirochaetota bacterium]|nr:DUF4389 domain-containing protein [Spirochaetota bacterium]